MKQFKWLAVIALTILLVVVGGYREIIFVNINEQILFTDGLKSEYRVLDSFAWLQEYSSAELSTLKWILTILFSLVFLLLGYVALRYLLFDSKGALWLMYTYVAATLLAGFFFIVGRVFDLAELGYTLSRVFMGALQSPFILMLMIPARMLVRRK